MSRPGEDLAIPPGPGLPQGLVLPAVELVERFSRSAGPGGQSVNTTDSRVELVFDVASSTALTDPQRRRALARLAGQLVDGSVVMVASEHRSQHRNRVAARERLADLLRRRARATAAASSADEADQGVAAAPAQGEEGARRDQGAPGPGARRVELE